MAISEQQLSTWSNIGATVASGTTYTSVKTGIDSINWRDIVSYDIYLQGSYRNSTNIYGESDVDIVAQLTSIFNYDTSTLTENQVSQFQQIYSKEAEFTLEGFKQATFEGLQKYYGANYVSLGNKAIDIEAANGRLHADVLCCIEHRKYNSFSTTNTQDYISGIKFYVSNENRWSINFPKQHYQNGVDKNSYDRTRQNYKPVTRIFKNAKAYLVNNNTISNDLAPSYFTQCLLYNLSDNLFIGNSYQSIFQQLIVAIANAINNNQLDNFRCQNGQLKLFGTAKEQWTKENATQFAQALIQLYNEW